MTNHTQMNRVHGFVLGSFMLAVGVAGCGAAAAQDVAYEDAYGADYYYPTDVAAAGVYAGYGGAYGLYYAVPTGTVGGSRAAATSADAGTPMSGSTSGSINVRGAVAQAIRQAAVGTNVCAGQVTVTNHTGPVVCGNGSAGEQIVFNGCQLSSGGTIDGTVDVQLTRSGADTNCDASTTITLAYNATITNLVYTGAGGAKIVIPSQTSTGTISYPYQTTPTGFSISTTGQVQRFGSGGTVTSDRTYTGMQTFSSVSLAAGSYTVSGTLTMQDQAGGSAVLTGMGLTRDDGCCKPTGGTLSVSRTGGRSPGQHTWTFANSCGSATLDGKSVSLPACL